MVAEDRLSMQPPPDPPPMLQGTSPPFKACEWNDAADTQPREDADHEYEAKRQTLQRTIQKTIETLQAMLAAPDTLLLSTLRKSKRRFALHEAYRNSSAAPSDAAAAIDEDAVAEESTIDVRHVHRLISQLLRVQQRLAETTTKLLITGDLNAGKSTFVNALLHADILPHDQQPCTMAFCEVLSNAATFEAPDDGSDAERIDVRAFKDVADANAFTPLSREAFRSAAADADAPFAWYKVFVGAHVACRSALQKALGAEVSVIDSPGLNSDFIKTMALFTKQQDIDVVVFIVNAPNHVTLSGREFLLEACREKAFVFIVVNRFDEIVAREKCKKTILAQIADVLPRTYAAASHMVHFVSARAYLAMHATNPEDEAVRSFSHAKDALRRFVVEKRIESKLLPAAAQVSHVIQEVTAAVEKTHAETWKRLQEATAMRAACLPAHQRISAAHSQFCAFLAAATEETRDRVAAACRVPLLAFSRALSATVAAVPWMGLTGTSRYVAAVNRELRLDANRRLAEASAAAVGCVTSAVYAMYGTFAAKFPFVFEAVRPNGEDGSEAVSACETLHPDVASIVAQAAAAPDVSHFFAPFSVGAVDVWCAVANVPSALLASMRVNALAGVAYVAGLMLVGRAATALLGGVLRASWRAMRRSALFNAAFGGGILVGSLCVAWRLRDAHRIAQRFLVQRAKTHFSHAQIPSMSRWNSAPLAHRPSPPIAEAAAAFFANNAASLMQTAAGALEVAWACRTQQLALAIERSKSDECRLRVSADALLSLGKALEVCRCDLQSFENPVAS